MYSFYITGRETKQTNKPQSVVLRLWPLKDTYCPYFRHLKPVKMGPVVIADPRTTNSSHIFSADESRRNSAIYISPNSSRFVGDLGSAITTPPVKMFMTIHWKLNPPSLATICITFIVCFLNARVLGRPEMF
jgi:hypothetical protein